MAGGEGDGDGTNHVYYHYPCVDGAYGALSAFLFLGPTARYVGHTVYAQPQEVSALLLDPVRPSDTVYLIDYAGSGPDFLIALAGRARQVILLDHHKTSLEAVTAMKEGGTFPSNILVTFDMHKSGATISWDHFSALKDLVPDPATKSELLAKLALVEDNDLWKHVLPGSKEFSVGLGDLKIEYSYAANPEVFQTLLSLNSAQVIAQGQRAQAERAIEIEKILAAAFVLKIKEVHCLGAETDRSELRSEVGNQLAVLSKERGHAPLGAVCYVVDGRMKVSLRATDGFDSTKVSEAFGGGGHRGASSFLTSIEEYTAMRRAP